ncbi:hypothetical protein CVP04_05735 [Caviibacterium pharyngocola]|uniref:Uncharacterized protein n=2 Tax=Caviibacterium pharyngocola TaxID=28159 RepID=A0A2M8RVF0_9PAST|nr:hypothetical protein CVP04_05735 [Caviibacterium pharyngocola]
MKDGYLEFFERFNISIEDFLRFAEDSIILIPKERAKKEWVNLKQRIQGEGQEVYVRSYARNGEGNYLYQEIYQELFPCKIIVDKTNNRYPTELLQELTGFNKNGRNANIQNFQVSHIFGCTKNPYAFCAPWNIAFIPKILDPFTGHESKGDLTNKITKIYKNRMWEEYEDLIQEYNNEMRTLECKINIYIENNKSMDKRIKKFHNSLLSEFAQINI